MLRLVRVRCAASANPAACAAEESVVPVASSLDYLTLIPGARHVVLPRTGHLGLIVKPREFAAAIDAFLS